MNKLLFAAALIAVATPAQTARSIIEESERRGHADSQQYEGSLEVVSANSKVSKQKRWQTIRLGSYGDSKSIIRFTAPAEINGVALLVINHPDRSADQWMWTPNTGRDRRIAPQDRSTRFFGTDFSFEDLEERDLNQFEYQLQADEFLDSVPCWRIDARPRQRKISQYNLSRMWIRKDNLVAAQYENLIKDKVVRRLRRRQIENIQGIWTARELEMTDLRRNSRTILRIDKLRYNLPTKEGDFTRLALRPNQ